LPSPFLVPIRFNKLLTQPSLTLGAALRGRPTSLHQVGLLRATHTTQRLTYLSRRVADLRAVVPRRLPRHRAAFASLAASLKPREPQQQNRS